MTRFRLAAVGAIIVTITLAACAPASVSQPEAPSDTASPAVDPTPTISSEQSAEASPSPSEQPTPTASVDSPEGFASGAWIETIVEGLQLREDPGLSAPSQGPLSVGTNATIIGGPAEADGFTWYQVASPGLPPGSGCFSDPATGSLGYCWVHGWVASAAENGDPWLTAATPDCPSAPVTVEDLALLPVGRALACFGDEELVLTSHVSPQASEIRECGIEIPVYEPAWFGDCQFHFLQATATEMEGQGPELYTHLAPEAGSCDFPGRSGAECPYAPFIGQWVEVTGHYDDPAAATCTVPDAAGRADLADPSYVIYTCRGRFVVTDVVAGSAP